MNVAVVVASKMFQQQRVANVIDVSKSTSWKDLFLCMLFLYGLLSEFSLRFSDIFFQKNLSGLKKGNLLLLFFKPPPPILLKTNITKLMQIFKEKSI